MFSERVVSEHFIVVEYSYNVLENFTIV